jgi:hypothetical protein
MSIKIQDVSAGSPMWRLVTGINQRLAATGYPSLRIDASGIAYTSLGNSGIYPGANMQSSMLWAALQESLILMSSAWFAPPLSGTTYTGQAIINPPGLVPIARLVIVAAFRAYTGIGELRSNNDFTRAGDIVGDWLIEDMQKSLSQMIYFSVQTPLSSGSQSLPGAVSALLCQNAYQRGKDEWLSATRGISSSPAIHADAGLKESVFGGFQVSSGSLSCRQQVSYSSSVNAEIIVMLFFRPSELGFPFHAPVPGAIENTLLEVGRYENARTLSINDAGITYADQFPLEYFNINCNSPRQAGFRAQMFAIAKGNFADFV